MADTQAARERREDSFLSSRGVDQSTVVLVGAILVVAFLVLSLIGRDIPNLVRGAGVGAAAAEPALEETNAPSPDIAGSVDIAAGGD